MMFRTMASEAEAERPLARGEVCSSHRMPPNFDARSTGGTILRYLVDADATDPDGHRNATAALPPIDRAQSRSAAEPAWRPGAAPRSNSSSMARYNPEQLTVLNTVRLICIVLMMSTYFMTTLSITKEREPHDGEPAGDAGAAIEVMLAKSCPIFSSVTFRYC